MKMYLGPEIVLPGHISSFIMRRMFMRRMFNRAIAARSRFSCTIPSHTER